MKVSSGVTAISTSADAEVNVPIYTDAAASVSIASGIGASAGVSWLNIYNSSANLGFFQINNGPWCPLAANAVTPIRVSESTYGELRAFRLDVKRVASGGNISVYAWGY